MHKTITFVLIILGGIICASKKLGVPSHNIKRVTSAFSQPDSSYNLCSTCFASGDDSLDILLNLILNGSTISTCGTLCQSLAEKTKSQLLGTFCDSACDAVGIEKFITLIKHADLDDIWYCELAKICPIKDDGDAKITTFSISPTTGPKKTSFYITVIYVSKNGIGTSGFAIDIYTLDHIILSGRYLLKAATAGTYSERLVVTSDPDPQCDPLQEECEKWLPGIYNVTVQICNGECGSKNPHSSIYDTAKGSFQVTK
ncbi:unnamed protein product [Rotaria sordida]|uniref:Uncharacterized protein n=1 Tax=Rotaria sordida TaxID=392033 RepID=A0A815THY6_9BILA|nr:unnamed protein product [Rotaria sordida]CAF1163025.1 unnamed protein product [Rotaria sordida]CAF1227590.1 unnamed protein product [Rotaria sordida]CAF1508795.1 unnamed protein product [Rotaria sordida]CAF3743382.1 unnamed protein product [Rotaria sordida]